ncbi:MAG: hypothetical protein SGILL_001121, partial [Bacillariaceae sp.]
MDTHKNNSEAPPIDKMDMSDHHEEMEDEQLDGQEEQQRKKPLDIEIGGGGGEKEKEEADADGHDESDDEDSDGKEEQDKLKEATSGDEGDQSDEEEGSEPPGEDGTEASGEKQGEENDKADIDGDESLDSDGSGDEDSEKSDGGESEEEDNPEQTIKQGLSAAKRKKKERFHVPKIFQDAFTVFIPLDVTADLRVAVQHTRAKRIKSIYKTFPALEKGAKKNDHKESDDQMTGEDDENAKENEEKKSAGKKKLEHIPQPEQFGSVLDYLEAKYVKGVMLDEDEEEGPNLDDNSEGNGSVYSKDSFLDDTDLQLDVAEQVMASTTLTKLELEQDDGDFFVNVGNLEVENDDYGENYNPLLDKENTK